MSTRGRSRARGRPPKSQSGGRGSTKKPRYLYAGGHANTIQYRQRLREGLRQDVYADTETDSEPSDIDLVDFEIKYEDAELNDNIKMELDSWKASSDEDRDDDEDYVEGGSVERLERSYPEERRRTYRRPTTPVFLQERQKPTLILPPSSEDLLLAPQFVMRALNVYEAMRRFGNILRLTPFIFEDFCAALDYPEHSALLSECHISLLKAVLREADSLNTHFGPQDLKDSINIHFYLVDHITWPAAIQLYLLADPEHRPTLLSFLGLPPDHDDSQPSDVPYQSEYPLNVSIECRLDILEFLVNQFLSTSPVRDEVVREGVPDHDDHCRVCHKLGDLLCCERCPAVFHLSCLDPPLDGVPSEEWICPVCVTNSVPGVTNCMSEMEKAGLSARHELLGYDREGRKYWFLARRIVGEGEQKDDVRYYSSVSQVKELLCYLDGNDYEAELVRALNEQMAEIERQMSITIELTTAANKTSRKSWLDENQSDVDTRIKIYNESVELMDIKPIKEEPVEVQTRSKTAAQSQIPFKLGVEGNFKTYSKLFTNHMLALNKHQHAEERDKKRHLSHKFSLTPASEFKWISIPSQATPVSDLTSVLTTVRNTIIHMESQLGSCLFHPQWTSTFRAEWLQAVNKSVRTRDYVRALQLLESVIKPTALVSAWTECLGHTFLRRTTQVEREEKKKQDKKERRGIAGFMALYSGVTEDGEDVSDRSLWCKYTLGLKHQVWKQKGEEFRITGTGGWYWNSRTRVVREQPMAKCGLRAGPSKISVYIPSSNTTRVVDVAKLENASVTKLSGEVADLKGSVLIRALCDQHRPEVEDVIDVAEALSDSRRRFYPRMTAGKAKLDSLLDKRINFGREVKKEIGRCDPDKILPPGLACYACTEATRLQCFSPLCRAYAKHQAESHKRGDTKQKFDLGFRSGPQKKVLRKKCLPPIQTFMTTAGKQRSVLVLDKVDYKRLSRKGGLGEAQGYNYLSKSNSEVWNYGSSPRPVLRTMWRWRNTQSLYNSCSWIALQLRILWHCLKWDDIAMKPPPGGSNTVTTDTQVETSELVKRRDLPPYFLRSEYLVRKITVPIDLPTKPRGKTTPQRSGLRERRRPESPQNKGPQISEVWTPEEHLEIWELKIFQEKLEKQIKDRQQEKVNTPATVGDRVQLVHITPRTTVVTSGVTTTINPGNIVGVRVVGPGKSPEEIRATMEANLRAQRLAHQNNKKILSVTPTSSSTGSVVVTGGGILSGQGGTVMQTTIGGLGVRRIVAQAGQGQIAQVQTVRNTGPKQIIIRPAAANATVIASGSGTRLVSPSAGTIIRQVGIRPQLQLNPELKTLATPVKSQVHLVQGPDGQLTVRGLQPGQQLLKLPDGRLQLVNLNQQKPIALNALPASGQPVQKIMIQAAPTGQPGSTGQRFIQIRPALPAGSSHLPTTTVRAVKIVQAAQPTGSPVVTAVSQAGSIIQAGSGQTVQVVQTTSGQAMVLNAGTVLTTTAGQAPGAATLVHPVGGQLPQKVVLSTLGQSPQLIVTNTTTPNVVPIKTELKREAPPSTPPAPKLIVTSQQLGSKLMNTMPPMQLVRATPVATIKSGSIPQTVANVSGGTTFVLTPAITQQIVKQASMTPTNSEIQPKVVSLQKSTTPPSAPTQIQTKTPPSILPATKKVAPILPQTFGVVAVKPEPPSDDTSENLSAAEETKGTSSSISPSATQPVLPAPAVTGVLNQTCQQVLGSIVTQVEKDEKRIQPAPRKHKLRDPEIQRKFQRSKALVNRHAYILRKSIMRKRALMEQKLALQVENEVGMEEMKLGLLGGSQPPPPPPSQPKKVATNPPSSLASSNGTQFKAASVVTKKVQSHVPLKPTQFKPQGQKAKKKRTASNSTFAANSPSPSTSPAKKKGKTMATPSKASSKVYCLCRRPYDPTKFMIGCDLCSNWFHTICIGVTEAQAQTMEGWVCLDCTQKKSDTEIELYCICRTPYDESQFYIYCDSCQGWFHGRCVGVLQSEANSIDVYICPDCRMKTGADEESLTLLNKQLTKVDLDNLKKLLLAVKNHKQAWPFKEPVNRRQAPDYYKVIKNPMDLRTVEQNLNASKYTTLQQFVIDMTLIFDNCRYYNSKESTFYSCADLLEAFFVQKMKLYKEALQRRM